MPLDEESETLDSLLGSRESSPSSLPSIAHRCLICGVLSDTVTEYHAAGDPLICWECCKQDVVLKCVCNHLQETQLMLQCETCFHWQHGPCENIHIIDHVPHPYTCTHCQENGKITDNIINRDLSVRNNELQS